MILERFNTAHTEVIKLVKTFADSHDKYLAPEYNEMQGRTDFIDKFFIALGWDVKHDEQTNPYEQEVKVERNVKVAARVKKADYAFFLKPDFQAERFFVEAKRPSAPLDTLDSCFQTIRYAFSSSRARLSILTNFKEFYIMDCRFRPDKDTAVKRIHKKYHFEDFSDREKFAEIYYLFGREAVADGSLEKYTDALPKPKGKGLQRKFRTDTFQDIDDAFLAKLEEYRNELAKMFKRKNARLTSDDLTEAVQRTLDRLVFIRFLEDKLIEPTTILDKFGDKPHPWRQFIARSRSFDKTYNGIIFKKHPIIDADDFAVDDKVFLAVCNDFADRYSPYHFNYIPIHILGSIYERFLGNVIVATAKQARIEAKPEVRKAGGVFYTPQYIVNYIVENTVGKLLSEPPALAGGPEMQKPARKQGRNIQVEGYALANARASAIKPADVAKMKFADIACGSGSFLLGVYEYLLRWHTKYYNQPNNKKEAREAGCIASEDGTFHLAFEQKKKILVNNVYGVDIDRQAYEVTQLSLFLKLLEEETLGSVQPMLTGHREALLPSLANNIVCGNALVGTDITGGDLFEQLDHDKEKKLNPMDFERRFPTIMANGGFDAIVGNPPYVRQEQLGDLKDYLQKHYDVFHGSADLYVFFIERYLTILKKNGEFGIIVANKWLRANYGQPLRNFLKQFGIVEIVDFGDLPVFQGVATYPCILRVCNSAAAESFEVTRVENLDFSGDSLNAYVLRNRYEVKHFEKADGGWSLSPSATQFILAKFTENATSVRDYVNGKIYYGIKTGLNPAFVIDAATKDALIADDSKSEELIKPFLAGRDIKRYVQPVAEKHIILMPKGWTHENYTGRSAWKWFEANYPAIAHHLKPYQNAAEARSDQGDYWWELRACDYYDEFSKPKIIYAEIAMRGQFHLDSEGFIGDTTSFILPSSDKYLLGILNSKLVTFFFERLSSTIRGGFLRWKAIYVNEIPIHKIDESNADEKAKHDLIVRAVEEIMKAKAKLAEARNDSDLEFWTNKCERLESDINTAVYSLYALTPDEIKLIEGA